MTQPRRKLSPTRILVILGLVLVTWLALRLARNAGEAYLESWLERQASARLGAVVTLEELEVDLLPLAARAVNVQVDSAEDGSLLARADRAEVGAAWRDLLAAPRKLRSVTIEAPRVVVRRYEDGSLNWPTFSAGEGGAGLAIDGVAVRRGVVEFNDRSVPLELDLRQMTALASGSTKTSFSARLDASEVVVGLPTGATYAGAVSARGAWEQGRLRVVSAQVSGPDLRATVSAGEVDLGDKAWSFDFRADGKAALFKRLGVGDSELAGDWRFTGTLSGDEAWRLAGRLSARDLGLDDFTLARLDGDLAADPRSISIAGIEGRFARGEVRADVEVAWAEPGRPVRVEAQLTNGSLPALLTKFDLDFPELAGSWGGRGHYVFKPEAPLEGDGSADLSLRAQDRAGTIAWRRRVPVDIKRGVASFRTLTTDTEAERLSARGTYDLEAGQADIDYRVDTRRLESWMRLIGLGQDPASAAWLPASGGGSVAGSFHLMPGDWWTRLTLDLEEVTVGAFSPAAVRGPLTVSAEGVRDLRLELTRFDAAMLLAGGIDTPAEAEPRFRLSVEASGWPTEEVLTQLGLPATVTGPLEGSARVTGTVDELVVSSFVEVAPAEIEGHSVDRIEGELDVSGNTLVVSAARVEMPAGQLRLDGAIPFEEGELELDFALALQDLSAAPIAGLLPEGSAGALSGRGSVGGTLDDPAVDAELETTDLRLAGQDLSLAGPSRLKVRLAGQRLEVDGTLGRLLEISGGGALTAERAELDFDVVSDQLAGLLALAAPGALAGIDGFFRGVVQFAGDLADGLPPPRVRLDELTLRYDEHELRALEPVRVAWRDDGLDVESFFLGDDATSSEIFLFGRLTLAEDSPLDLRGQISLDTEWFEPWIPGWELSGGRFEALASISGSLTDPAINGQGEVTQPRMWSEGLPAVRDANAVLLFYPDQIVVDDGEARFAGGRVRLAGSFDPFAELGFQYRFQIAADDMQLRYPEGWQVRGDAELVVASEAAGQIVRGRVEVDRALYTSDVPIGLTQLLQTAFSRRVELVEESDELLTSTRLNIVVRGDDALSVKNNVASLRGDLDFVIRGTLARPVIFGSVEVEEGSTLLYAGNTYDVQRASLKFANPYRIEPVIDLVATTSLAEYDVTLDLSGTLERLDVNFASDPPLADLQVLSLLAGGEASPSTFDAGAADSSGLAESFLYQQAASVVAARVNRLFGLDKFRIDPLTGDSGGLSSARVTVGKRLGRDLFATYSYDPSETGQQILELEWRVSRELTVVATQNGDESYAVDLRWDRSF